MKTKLTIERLKACVTFTGVLGDSLRGLIDCWYKIELKKGKSEEEAAEIALDKLGEKLKELGL